MEWLRVQTHNTGVVSSNPTCHNKNVIGEEDNRNQLIKSTSLGKTQEPCLWFLLLSKSSERCRIEQ